MISLALSAAVFYLNMNIKDDMLQISRKLLEGIYGGYDVYVSDASGAPMDSDGFDFGVNDGVLAVTYDSAVYEGDTSAVIVRTDLDTAQERGLIHISDSLAGYDPEDTAGAVIEEKKAAYFGIALGDEISVTDGDGGETAYSVTAFADALGIFTKETTDTLEVLTAPEPGAQVSGVFIDVQGDKRAYAAGLTAQYPELSASVLAEGSDSGRQLESMRRVLYLVISVTIAIGFYVISSVSTLLLDARAPVIGTFRSIGATRLGMNALLLLENAVYGVIGGALGIGLGELVRRLLATLFYSAGGAVGTVDIGYILLSIAFAAGLQILVTLGSVLKAGRRSIRENMFKTSAVASNVSIVRSIIGGLMFAAAAVIFYTNTSYGFFRNVLALVLSIFGTALLVPLLAWGFSRLLARPVRDNIGGPGYLAIKNLAVSKIDRSSIVLTCIVMALAFVIYLFAASVGRFFDEYEKNYPYDIFIKSLNRSAETYDFLGDTEGVADLTVEYWDYRESPINGENTHLCFVCRGGYSNGVTVKDSLLGGLQDGHVLFDSLLAVQTGVKTGDTVALDGFCAVVDGFCDSGVLNSKRSSVIMTEGDYLRYVEESPALIGVTVEQGANLPDVIRALEIAVYKHTGENASVHSKQTYVTQEMENTRNAMKVFSVVPVIAALLSVLGLVNNQMIAFNRKRREYAVLYSVAMSRAQLGRMVFFELICVFFVGSAVGALLSLWLVNIVRDIFFSLIAYIEIKVNILSMLGILAAALALLCLTGVAPLRRARKMNFLEEIKYE